MFWDKKTVITFPWKTATPFSNAGVTSSGTSSLVLLCPIPSGVDLDDDEQPMLLEVSGAFASIDYLSTRTNLDRLEFIRRYMEQGMNAIQPDPEAIRKGLVSKPTGKSKEMTFKEYGWDGYLLTLISRIGYVIATGWWVDKWLENRTNKCVWPEEVEQLCTEGADVSLYDTTVITPRSDLFYGHKEGQFTYFDRYGNEVT